MNAAAASDLFRLLAVTALSITLMATPASAQWEDDGDCLFYGGLFAGCFLCLWDLPTGETCEVTDCFIFGFSSTHLSCPSAN